MARGCQLSNINMCTTIYHSPRKNLINFSALFYYLFSQTQCYVENIKTLAGNMQFDLIDLEGVESHQGAGERQKCLEDIYNLPLPFVLYLVAVMLGIDCADEKDEQISKLK